MSSAVDGVESTASKSIMIRLNLSLLLLSDGRRYKTFGGDSTNEGFRILPFSTDRLEEGYTRLSSVDG